MSYGSSAEEAGLEGVHVVSEELRTLVNDEQHHVVEAKHSRPSRKAMMATMAVMLAGAAGVATIALRKRAENEFTYEALWTRLDDPDQLLEYAAQFHPKDAGTWVLDDENFYPLSCSKYDDDTVYPNELCLAGDNQTCNSMPDNYYSVCSEACSEGWGVPCGWEAIADLPEVCTGDFSSSFPESSKNIGKHPLNDATFGAVTIESTGEQVWACNVHAFCYSCVDTDNTVNDYCKAAVIRTQTLFAPSAVFKYMDDYWCDDAILGDIADGTFCGLSSDKMDLCQETRSHALYDAIVQEEERR